jgi:hypothetical protein
MYPGVGLVEAADHELVVYLVTVHRRHLVKGQGQEASMTAQGAAS